MKNQKNTLFLLVFLSLSLSCFFFSGCNKFGGKVKAADEKIETNEFINLVKDIESIPDAEAYIKAQKILESLPDKELVAYNFENLQLRIIYIVDGKRIVCDTSNKPQPKAFSHFCAFKGMEIRERLRKEIPWLATVPL
uniref:Uncharacterized protein n=1 Tax=candidate division CPR3 bacterium TaxID=2268181 RepID=A0A7C4M009_UNCC3